MGAVFNRVTLSATGDTLLASAGQNAGDAGWQLTFAGTSWTGSVVLKQNTAPPGAAVSLSTVSYFNATTGALVAAGTAISSGGSFIVANTGLDLYAVYTHTAGTVQITLGAGSGQFGGVAVAAADVTAGTFGAFTGETGTYAFPGAITAVGAVTGAAGSFTTLAASGVVTLTNATEATTGPAGALVLTGGLYVAKKVFSIGNLTVGASTFVVTAATGAAASTATGNVLYAGGTTTSGRFIRFQNTGGDMNLGIESSVGGAALTGSTAYATFLSSNNATPLHLGTNTTVRLTIAADGSLATFTGAIAITGAAITQPAGVLSIGGTQQTTVGAAGGASALPATPTGYIKTYIGAAQFVIPYYAQV